jgi:tetratricopeptide (TPR) repeat protein
LADLEMDLADQRSADGAAPDYRAAIAQYRAWLASNPKAEGRDAVLYQLARALEQGGDSTAALATLDGLVAAHPASVHRDEAEFRRGELLFAARRWADAEAAYSTVLQAGAGNPWLDRALYMQGWSRYRQGRWNDALDSLFGVLDLKLGGKPAEPLPRAEQELVDDSLRVTALSLEQLHGAAAIAPHVQGERRRAYAWRVYEQLAALYQQQGRVRDATDTWQRFAQSQPLAPQAALARQRVVQVQDAAGFAALALQARRDFVQAHVPGATGTVPRQPSTPRPGAGGASMSTPWPATITRWPSRRARPPRSTPPSTGTGWRCSTPTTRARASGASCWPNCCSMPAASPPRWRPTKKPATATPRTPAVPTRPMPRCWRAAGWWRPATPPRARLCSASSWRPRSVSCRAFDTDARAAAVLANAAELQWTLADGPAARALAVQVLARADAGVEARRQAHAVIGDVALAAQDPAGAEQAYAQVLALVPTRRPASKAVMPSAWPPPSTARAKPNARPAARPTRHATSPAWAGRRRTAAPRRRRCTTARCSSSR